jgi:hypothetical protein
MYRQRSYAHSYKIERGEAALKTNHKEKVWSRNRHLELQWMAISLRDSFKSHFPYYGHWSLEKGECIFEWKSMVERSLNAWSPIVLCSDLHFKLANLLILLRVYVKIH